MYDRQIKNCIRNIDIDSLQKKEKKELETLFVLYKIFDYNWNIFAIIFVYLLFQKS